MLTALTMNRASLSLATLPASATTAARPFAAGICARFSTNGTESVGVNQRFVTKARIVSAPTPIEANLVSLIVRTSSGDFSHTRLLTVAVPEIAEIGRAHV